MSSLNPIEKRKLEKFFGMDSGYVLDLTNASFENIVRDSVSKEIYSDDYSFNGDSKAKRLRAFWEIESAEVVGRLLKDLIEVWHFENEGNISEANEALSEVCLSIAKQLAGEVGQEKAFNQSEKDFLEKEFGDLTLEKLKLEDGLISVLTQRLEEIRIGLAHGASLSVIFLCGSSLEGILLGIANRMAREFNTAKSCPKDKVTQKPLPFTYWSLSSLIDVAHEVGLLGLDIKKFGHSLRDFRNFIHPNEQWKSDFQPDHHTARICWQVFQAAVNDISKSHNINA